MGVPGNWKKVGCSLLKGDTQTLSGENGENQGDSQREYRSWYLWKSVQSHHRHAALSVCLFLPPNK